MYVPYNHFPIMLWILLRPTRTQPRPLGQSQGKAPWGRGGQEPNKFSSCETGPTVFRPYPRKLESLTVCPFADVIVKHFFISHLKILSVGPARV